jgi:hypothetical protein
MHSEAMIVRTSWQKWSEFGDTLGGRDQASLVIHFGGGRSARLEEYLEPVNGQRAGCCDCLDHLVDLQTWECNKVTNPLSSHGKQAEGGRSCKEVYRKLMLHSGVNF